MFIIIKCNIKKFILVIHINKTGEAFQSIPKYYTEWLIFLFTFFLL